MVQASLPMLLQCLQAQFWGSKPCFGKGCQWESSLVPGGFVSLGYYWNIVNWILRAFHLVEPLWSEIESDVPRFLFHQDFLCSAGFVDYRRDFWNHSLKNAGTVYVCTVLLIHAFLEQILHFWLHFQRILSLSRLGWSRPSFFRRWIFMISIASLILFKHLVHYLTFPWSDWCIFSL